MEPKNIVEQVVQGHIKNGWAVFHFSKKEALKSIVFRSFYLILFGGCAFALFLTIKTAGNIGYLFGGIFTLIDLYLIYSIITLASAISSAKRNMIICTDTHVIKSYMGQIDEYPYENISKLRITNPMPDNTPVVARRHEQYIDFTDKRTGKMIELSHNYTFGPPGPIFNFLNSKLA